MQIIIGKTAGLCFGITNAAVKAEEEAERNGRIYCLGELAHNNEIKKDLEGKGVVFIEDINEAKDKVIIRAHGEAKETYEKAEDAGIELIDLTCPKVLKIHKLVEEYKNRGYYIFLIGETKHPEIIGTISYAGDASNVVENIDDVPNAIKGLEESNKRDVLIICQTTISLEKFNTITGEIKNKLSKDVNLEVINTICETTQLREDEAAEISKQVELMIIIGGKNSSNTKKLYEISNKYCKNAIWIESGEELNLQYVRGFDKIGIMAGASTPEKSIRQVVEMLQGI
ncbi:MAG: 4-hydroxy-3-methylbut-2-enyl diphosphate reductase [Firmicutes bacterium]|nr:4-hydroxy-3-methylbut-2-enyl diphosphate reductase [Bacillota bacterium]